VREKIKMKNSKHKLESSEQNQKTKPPISYSSVSNSEVGKGTDLNKQIRKNRYGDSRGTMRK
jgi:hypothetical protein